MSKYDSLPAGMIPSAREDAALEERRLLQEEITEGLHLYSAMTKIARDCYRRDMNAWIIDDQYIELALLPAERKAFKKIFKRSPL